jgi:isopentenyl-diphosphate delta-isomerase
VTLSREAHLVELVDESGVACGQSTVADAHRAPGLLHRAFSVFLQDPAGRLLLQRRAAGKTRFPLRWANACCGHPAPGQPLLAAAGQRLDDELTVTGVDLVEVGVHLYHAADPATGLVEREWDHVLLGRVGTDIPLRPDPAEVAAVRWVSPDELRGELATRPAAFAPWLSGVLARLTPDKVPSPDPGHVK